MRRVLKVALATAAIGLVSMPTAANAALTVQGVTYDLILNSVSGNTGNFTLQISGVNTASDTKGGRTGIDSFAFNNPSIGSATSGTSTGFTFQTGGLSNSAGCNGQGNFFCFDNSGYTLVLGPGGTTSINFSVTSNAAGSWNNYSGDFKINWLGSANNYDLVSQVIQARPAVPEPATWAMMLVGFGGIGMAMRRRKVNVRLAQVA